MNPEPMRMQQLDDKARGVLPAGSAASSSDLRDSSGWIFWVVAAVCLVLLGVQIAHYYPFMGDDAFISLRYSQRLLEGKGLTWSGDQRTEGYTNLLWVLLCALLGFLHIDMVSAARLLGVFCTLAAFAAIVAYIVTRFPARERALAAACSLLPFALSAPIAVWAIGGLEQPLVIALLAWATFFALRWLRGGTMASVWACGALLALLTLTRADGFGFVLLFGIALMMSGRGRQSAGAAGRLLVLPSFLLMAQFAFRRVYYQDWLPNTARVKVSFTTHRLITGRDYVQVGLGLELPLFILAAVGIAMLWWRRERAIAFLLAFVSTAFLAYLVLVGGDIFPSSRLMLPAILLACFAAAEAAWLGFGARGWVRYAAVAGMVLCAALTVNSRAGSALAISERWEWDGKSLGLALRAGFGDKHPVLVADCAGALPFYSQFEALDPLGLNDRYISRRPEASRGRGFMGHELGDGSYILDHKPEIVLFGKPSGSAFPFFNSDLQIYNDKRFAPAYQMVVLHVTADPAAGGPAEENPDLISVFFIRRTDGRLGIEATPERLTVPAYLAKPDGTAIIAASVADGVRLVLPSKGAAYVERVPLPPGRWRVSTDNAAVGGEVVLPEDASGATTTALVRLRNPLAKTVDVRTIYLDLRPEQN